MIPNEKPILKVSQVAKHLNISSDRLRTYDEQKLIEPAREHNVRLYSNFDVEWLENLRTLIKKDRLTIMSFQEILKLMYFMQDKDFDNFVKTQPKDSIWFTLSKMRKNPNFEKLRKIYVPE